MSPHPRSRSLPPRFNYVAEVDANRTRAFTHNRPASTGNRDVEHLVAQHEDETEITTTGKIDADPLITHKDDESTTASSDGCESTRTSRRRRRGRRRRPRDGAPGAEH